MAQKSPNHIVIAIPRELAEDYVRIINTPGIATSEHYRVELDLFNFVARSLKQKLKDEQDG